MIKVQITDNSLDIKGHACTEVCACVSMLGQELANCWDTCDITLEKGYTFVSKDYLTFEDKVVFRFVIRCLEDLVFAYPEEIELKGGD